MAERLSNIQTNIITGFLGAGKSTAILSLLEQKPDDERWAVLVNEFGEVGIDGGMLAGNSDSGIYIREVPGGCMCCAAGLPMQMAMNMLLARAKPTRLIIEPTGLGHPFEVMSVLAADHYQELLDLRSTLTLVDGRKISEPKYTNHPTFNQQLEIADVIVASKADLYAEDTLTQLKDFLSNKGLLEDRPLMTSSGGQLDLVWLEGKARAWQLEPAKLREITETDTAAEPELPEEGFVRMSNHGEGYESFGWLFHADFTFNRDAIAGLLKATRAERIKAIIKSDQGNVAFNSAEDSMEQFPLRDLEDSRLEIITTDEFDADAFETKLLAACSR